MSTLNATSGISSSNQTGFPVVSPINKTDLFVPVIASIKRPDSYYEERYRKPNGTILSRFPPILISIVNSARVEVATSTNSSLSTTCFASHDYVRPNTFVSWEAIQVFEGIVAILLNISVFLLVILNGNLRRRKSYQLLLSIFIIHVLLHSASITFVFHYSPCGSIILVNAVLMEMFSTLMVTTCNRFVAIQFPFIHKKLQTKHVIIVVVLAWLPGVIFALVTSFGSSILNVAERDLVIMGIIMTVLSATVLAVSNILVYIAAKRHDEFLRKNSSASQPPRKMLRASYVCFGIVSSFVILWLPFLIKDGLTITHSQLEINYHFSEAVEKIAYLNSILDPVLFVCLCEDAKKQVKKLSRTVKMHW